MFCCSSTIRSINIPAKDAQIGDVLYCGHHFLGTHKKYRIYLRIREIEFYQQFNTMIFRFEIDEKYKRLAFDSLEISETRMIKVEREVSCFSFAIS